jgi:hypothetical protein
MSRAGRGRGWRRIALAACAVVAAALGVVPSVATAAGVPEGAVYAASGGSVTRFRWEWQQAGAPDRCRNWGRSNGFVRVRLTERGGFDLFTMPRLGFTGGMKSLSGGSLWVERDLDYRIHRAATTRDCITCGGELGRCPDDDGEQFPDDVGHSGCKPPASTGSLIVSLVRGTLLVQPAARSEQILRDCSSKVPRGVAIGPPEPMLKPVRFPGAGRRIAALARGRSVRFRAPLDGRYDCVPRGRKGEEMRRCTVTLTEVTVRRLR